MDLLERVVLEGLTKVYLRGVGGARVLVLVDGVRFQDPSTKYGADFSRLLLSNVERIELISGAQSGVWGADATCWSYKYHHNRCQRERLS